MRNAVWPFATSTSLAVVYGLFVAPAHAVPVANLPLTCSSASAIGQPQNNCGGDWLYLAPTNDQLIVLKGPASAPTWARAASLDNNETLAVCALPVEPGNYSSCKDSAGVRRIVYLAKSQVFASSPPPGGGTGGIVPRSIAVVAASGGHYTDPLAAVANVSQGDAWCRSASDDPARFPCVISIAPGIYELASTLVVPAHVAVVGHGPSMTVLTARSGVAVTVQLGFATLDSTSGVALRDLAVENPSGAGGASVALDIIDNASVQVYNVRATASGASDNIGVRYAGRSSSGSLTNQLERLEAAASGGSTSTGFKIVNHRHARIEQCKISAAQASNRNVGVESDGGASIARCEIAATGGVTAIAMSFVGRSGHTNDAAGSDVSDSTLVAQQASTENTGYFSRGTYGATWKGVDVTVQGPGSTTGIWLFQGLPFGEGYFERVRVRATGGMTNAALHLEAGHHDGLSMTVVDSTLTGLGGGAGYGVRLGQGTEAERLHVLRSQIVGSSASLFNDGPFQEWQGNGPPLFIRLTGTSLQGIIDLNRHYLTCVAVIDYDDFYPETCPPGDWTPTPGRSSNSPP